MPESHPELAEVVKYMQAHWPSQVKPEWQVKLQDYPAILTKVVEELTAGATKHHFLVRVAGISGSGKTTQILPAVEAYCEAHHYQPILIAARRFVEYHPHYQAIKDFYGEQNLRKMTDEFTTIMLFMALARLTHEGYDIVLDVTLLDPKMEAILLRFLKSANYKMLILMVAVSPQVTEHYLAQRTWRHTKATEAEFIRATQDALQFYAKHTPNSRIIIWSVYHASPEYDGPINLPAKDDAERRAAKIRYLQLI